MKNNIQLLLGVLMIVVVSVPSLAQDRGTTLSLDQAIVLALEKNPTITIARQMVVEAEARQDEARSGFLPRVDVYERFTRSNDPMTVVGNKLNQEKFSATDYELDNLNNPSLQNNFHTQFVVTQPLFDQGKTFVGVKHARFGKETAEEDRKRVEQEVVFQVIKAYSQVIMAKEDLGLAEETEKTARAHVKLAKDLFETGQGVKSDLLSAKVRLSEVQEMIIQAKNNESIARAALNQIMGIDQTQVIEVYHDLGYEGRYGDLEDLIQDALQHRPDLLALKGRVAMREESVRMEKTGYLPSVELVAQYDLNDENHVWGADGKSWTIGAVCRLNLFDGLDTSARLQEAKARHSQYVYRQKELVNRIELEVRESFHRAQEAKERVAVTSEATVHAEESLRIVEDRYSVGLTTIVEMLDNEIALTRARRNHLKAVHDCRISQARLDFVRGTLASSMVREQ